MNIYKFLDSQQDKGNILITYDGEVLSYAKAEAEAKKSYLADFENCKELTFAEYVTEWLSYNTISVNKAITSIKNTFNDIELTDEVEQ